MNLNLFNKKEQKKEKMITIRINKKYQMLLTLITFESQKNYSDAIENLLKIVDEKNESVEIAISELTYLRLKNIMHEKNMNDFNELFKSLLY